VRRRRRRQGGAGAGGGGGGGQRHLVSHSWHWCLCCLLLTMKCTHMVKLADYQIFQYEYH
jgi:hypothetical protein